MTEFFHEPSEKGECKYCGKEIHPANTRCGECDDAWQDGHGAGYKEHKDKISEVLGMLSGLLGLRIVKEGE